MKIKLLRLLIILALFILAGFAAAMADDSLDVNIDSGDNIINYFPERFNLADENLVSKVKDQGQHGNAWTFAVMGALESNYLVNAYAESLDLSPLHTAWFAYNDAVAGRAFTFIGDDYEPVYMLENGQDNNLKALALFSRLNGPVLNSQLAYPAANALPWRPEDELIKPSLPYNIKVNGTERVYNTFADMPAQTETSSLYTPALRVTEALFNVASGDMLIKDFIKSMILENGAVAAGINLYDHNFTNSYFSKGYAGGEASLLCVHNVLIVGWDDNYSRDNFGMKSLEGWQDWHKPDANGAWIAQNSWGTDWGDNGYFYISYEEPLKTPIAFVTEPYDSHIRHYGNDLLGYTGTITLGSGEGSSTAWSAAALRVAGDHEKLREVGFYTLEPNMNYEIYIYKNGNITAVTSPISSEQLTVVTGSFEYPGWHVVKLPKAIPIDKGCMFSIILSLTSETGPARLAVETKISGTETANAIINTGSSFFSLNGLSWEDGTKISGLIAQSSEESGDITAADACIKAFTYIPDPARPEDWTVYINKNKAEIQIPLYSLTQLKKKDIEITAFGLEKLKYSVKLEKSSTVSAASSNSDAEKSSSSNSTQSVGNFYTLKISAKIDEADPAITSLVIDEQNVALPLGGIKLSAMTAVDSNPNVSTSSSKTYSNQRYKGCNNLNLSSGLLLMLLALAALLKFKVK